MQIQEIESIILSSISHEIDILFKEKVAKDLFLDYAKGSSKRTRTTIRYSSLIWWIRKDAGLHRQKVDRYAICPISWA